MKRHIFIALTIISSYLPAFGQEVSLQECWNYAKEHYPKTKDREILLENTKLRINNLETNWLPKLNFNGQATWQNDIPHIPGTESKIDLPNKDQYKLTLDINQTIYDGGSTSAKKKIENSSSTIELLNLDIELYDVKKSVTSAYFLYLALDEQQKQLLLNKENLEARLKEMNASLLAGTVLQSEVSVVKVELLKLDQRNNEITEGKNSALETLALITGQPFSPEKTTLSMLKIEPLSDQNLRLEYQLFDQQKLLLQNQAKLASTNRMFQINGFAQAGMGNPGMNVLAVEWGPIVYMGVKLQWNIWDWKQTARQKKIYMQNSASVDNQKALFEQNQNIGRQKLVNQINRIEKALLLDDQIIELRKEVTLNSKAKLNNGTLRASDYIYDLNMEATAELEKKIRQLQLDQARIELMQLLGQNN